MIKNVILDLDHTLILAFNKTELRRHGCAVSDTLKMHFFEPFVIFERPGLARFLKQLSSEYVVSVWTAGTEEYGQFIINTIIAPHLTTPLKLFLHSKQCDVSLQRFGLLKHLNLLYAHFPDFTRENTVLIDDNPEVQQQDNHVILIKQFSLNPCDRSLAAVYRKIKNLE